MVVNGVLKRDTLDGDGTTAAKATLKKATLGAARRIAKAAAKSDSEEGKNGS
jgi:hypothetical protein